MSEPFVQAAPREGYFGKERFAIAYLTQSLGMVEAERFIALILREPFDYTVWQRNLYKDV